MARIITKEIALEIVRKLGAVKNSKKNRPHDVYTFIHRGQVVARFGIRRSSSKDQGHDYISGAMHISTTEAKTFGICGHTLQWYISEMIRKGVIEE
jgi:hypothetical protein